MFKSMVRHVMHRAAQEILMIWFDLCWLLNVLELEATVPSFAMAPKAKHQKKKHRRAKPAASDEKYRAGKQPFSCIFFVYLSFDFR